MDLTVMAKLYFITGAMDAGKSAQLLAKNHNYLENGKTTLIVKPTTDTRDGTFWHGEWGMTYSRAIKDGARCLFADPGRWGELSPVVEALHPDIVFVDEAQFLTRDDVMTLTDWVDELEIPVLCYGLKTTAEAELFEGSEVLLAMADEIEIMISVCSFCGRRASHHVRISGGKKLVGNAGVEGNGVAYKSCCRRCFKKAMAANAK